MFNYYNTLVATSEKDVGPVLSVGLLGYGLMGRSDIGSLGSLVLNRLDWALQNVQEGAYRGSSTHRSFLSPTRGSWGTAHQSSLGKNKYANVDHSPTIDHGFEANDCNMGPKELRQSLVDQGSGACIDFTIPTDDTEENGSEGGFPDFGHDFDVPESMTMKEDASFHHDKHGAAMAHFGTDEAFDNVGPSSQETLEDLCRSHLVNNGDVDLDRSGARNEPVCYSSMNPFHIRLLDHDRRRMKTPFQLSKKRGKSPVTKESTKCEGDKSAFSPAINSASENGSTIISSRPNCKVSAKLRGIGGIRCCKDRSEVPNLGLLQ
ncbi:hypothetical protein SLEP1_g98 [Rubroshorea leprosula]|uniref:Uncharacterized protein n=1 Tax=Rubroshorea leprosula TaxID=152421 RepID=A0AAV5HJV1_9ROSI|nr:hypothetical protein SLEP1_g98 [Rubroshorea leprosula]